jgi:putative aminopeptidase FrvX
MAVTQEARLTRTLKELVALHGAPGSEGDVYHYVEKRLAGRVDECYGDTFGNLITVARGDPSMPSVMFVAHMDEIALMVSRIEETGFIRFEKLGFPIDAMLPGRKVMVGKAVGVIGGKDFHFMTPEEAKVVREVKELFVDVGAHSISEVKAMGIRLGTPITFISEWTELGTGGSVVCSKSMDDRVGCTLLLELMSELKDLRAPGTVYGVFSSQEEVGLRGARVAGHRLNPTFTIGLDNTLTSDTPFYPAPTEDTIVLGGGPLICLREDFISAMRGMLAHPAITGYLERSAQKAGIKYQLGILMPLAVGDATAVHDVRDGIPACTVGVPSRYAHSPVEIIDLRDVEETYKLLKEAVTNVTPDLNLKRF